jgi:signal transduction histidine kinase
MLPLRIDEILWKTRAELMERNKINNISIKFNELIDDENELTVLGNEQLLKTAIVNLMDNACKFSSNNSADVSLTVEGKFIVVEIVDNGIGIDQADIDNIFHPFFRANNAKNIPGNGLGLSLTDKIIALHQGTITIDSQLGVGTKVKVTMPNLS